MRVSPSERDLGDAAPGVKHARGDESSSEIHGTGGGTTLSTRDTASVENAGDRRRPRSCARGIAVTTYVVTDR